MQELAEAAAQIADGKGVRVPHLERTDEIGVLANALQSWQDATAEREILIDQVPVGVCRVDRERRMPMVNVDGVLAVAAPGPEQWSLILWNFARFLRSSTLSIGSCRFTGRTECSWLQGICSTVGGTFVSSFS